MSVIQGIAATASSLPPASSLSGKTDSDGDCHGFLHNAALLLCSTTFVLYLAFHAKKNVRKLRHGRSLIMIAYYLLLWFTALLNLAWCSLQWPVNKLDRL
ncbi:hypothetical protein RJ639_019204 [Escallonia herrerae]|uniref:Uncharacterized protein n=1 Tax=Escallonia herrerae TaxID=1293975 RepID=A0AA88V852_9ASTE|nr:hypothetical protein RJ639_019204 [Escallonia herrerae]